MKKTLVLANSFSSCNCHTLHTKGKFYQVEEEENSKLMRLIEEELLRYPFDGSLKMKVYLIRAGFPANRKRVQI